MSSPLRMRPADAADDAGLSRVRLAAVPRTARRIGRAPRIPFVTLVGLVLLIGVVGLLLFNTSMQQSSFATTALQGQADELTAREQILRMQIDELRDPQRVAQRAVAQGMVLPPSSAVLHLPSGRVDGEPTPASAEDGVAIRPTQPVRPGILDPDPVRVPRSRSDEGNDQFPSGPSDTASGDRDQSRPRDRNANNGRDGEPGNGRADRPRNQPNQNG